MKHLTVELNQTPEAVDMDTGKPVLPTPNTFRDIFEIKETVVEKRPTMSAKKEKQVKVFLDRAASLIAKYDIYEQDHMKRGNKALYECMEYTYDYALDVFNSPLKEDILDAMRWRTKNTTGKMPSASTPPMTLIVKYVFGDTDRQKAHIYSRALRVAYDEDVPVTSLVKYIEDAGGVTKITGTKADKAKTQLQQEILAERAELLRRLYVARGELATSPEFVFNEPILQWDIKTAKAKKANEKESSKDTGDFVIMIATYDRKIGKYRAIEGNDFGAPFEMGMFRHMAARITTDVKVMKKKVQEVERAAWGESMEEYRERLLTPSNDAKSSLSEEDKKRALEHVKNSKAKAKEEELPNAA